MDLNSCFMHLNVGLPDDIRRRKEFGDFEGAIRLIDRRINDPAIGEGLRSCMTVQKEIMRRLPDDFPYTRESALAEIRKSIPDFSDAEFDERVDRGTIRWIYFNGEPRYFRSFFATLVKTEPEFARRAGEIPSTLAARPSAENPLDRCIRIMKEQGSMSCRIRIRATLQIEDDIFLPGSLVLACIPVPSACDAQSDIRIERIWPDTGIADPEDTPQRTVWWKERMNENHAFIVEYSYIRKQTWYSESHIGASDADASRFLEEQAPHIVFTPYIRELVQHLTEGAKNDLEKARRLYDYITIHMHYTYMPEYFTMENIADTCAHERTGDCGVFALLLITMLRCAGIPACWESGNAAEPDDIGCHDWVRYYVEPCGWLYADPSYGVSSHRVGNEERRDFYSRNLEPYRMSANNAFQAAFLCDKEGWRADPYDNQTGEIEQNGVGLRYHEFSATKQILLHEEI